MNKGSHYLILQARQYFNEKNLDNYGCCNLKYYGAVSIRSTIINSERAMNIMNIIIISLEKLGYKVEISKENKGYKTYTYLKGERIAFMVEECVKKIPHTPTEKELEIKKKWGYSYWNKYDHIPSNKFIISIDCLGLSRKNLRLKWYDTKSKKLEDQIPYFIAGLEEVAFRLTKAKLEEKERQVIYLQNRERNIELTELLQAELEKIEILENEMESYYKSIQIMQYINDIKDKNLTPFQQNLMKWAKEYADHLDPTNEFNIDVLCEE